MLNIQRTIEKSLDANKEIITCWLSAVAVIRIVKRVIREKTGIEVGAPNERTYERTNAPEVKVRYFNENKS